MDYDDSSDSAEDQRYRKSNMSPTTKLICSNQSKSSSVALSDLLVASSTREMCALLEKVIEELRADKRTAVSAFIAHPKFTAVITHLMREYCRAAASNESRLVGYVAFILGTLCDSESPNHSETIIGVLDAATASAPFGFDIIESSIQAMQPYSSGTDSSHFDSPSHRQQSAFRYPPAPPPKSILKHSLRTGESGSPEEPRALTARAYTETLMNVTGMLATLAESAHGRAWLLGLPTSNHQSQQSAGAGQPNVNAYSPRLQQQPQPKHRSREHAEAAVRRLEAFLHAIARHMLSSDAWTASNSALIIARLTLDEVGCAAILATGRSPLERSPAHLVATGTGTGSVGVGAAAAAGVGSGSLSLAIQRVDSGLADCDPDVVDTIIHQLIICLQADHVGIHTDGLRHSDSAFSRMLADIVLLPQVIFDRDHCIVNKTLLVGCAMNAAFAIGRISDHPEGRKRILSSPDCNRMACSLITIY